MLEVVDKYKSYTKHVSATVGISLIMLTSPIVAILVYRLAIGDLIHASRTGIGNALLFLSIFLGGIILVYQSNHLEDNVSQSAEVIEPEDVDEEELSEEDEYCGECYGSGECQCCDGAGIDDEDEDCIDCDGTGECSVCAGTGYK